MSETAEELQRILDVVGAADTKANPGINTRGTCNSKSKSKSIIINNNNNDNKVPRSIHHIQFSVSEPTVCWDDYSRHFLQQDIGQSTRNFRRKSCINSGKARHSKCCQRLWTPPDPAPTS
ncbi:hypothetical protein Pcinc_007939 [Petrolisthes cinctipes]|uniref:Uncharacterized protein n=1 Tax=Petrolisthes cinctipes TaxID=88211 RepID=A0AAE1KWY5_PETCI|nr:hypothetical protein Pcinc_010586 [Petrolisthes cinctipes]KAK3887979.1 hypothetical protein Pcinc_007939 [Petrolisthes cinctipes]